MINVHSSNDDDSVDHNHTCFCLTLTVGGYGGGGRGQVPGGLVPGGVGPGGLGLGGGTKKPTVVFMYHQSKIERQTFDKKLKWCILQCLKS